MVGEQRVIQIERDHFVDEVLQLYDDSSISSLPIKVEFLRESGDDFGGLSKDMLSSVWRSITRDFFTGEQVVVPSLPLHRMAHDRTKYIQIGRLLSHSAAILRQLPARISRVTLAMITCDDVIESVISDDILLQEFLLFLTAEHKALLRKNLSEFTDNDRDALIDFFSEYRMYAIPSADTIRDNVITIARDVLVDKPLPLINLMRNGICLQHRQEFWSHLTMDHISHLCASQMPNPQKVIDALETENEDLRFDEDLCLSYLKQFIRKLDHDELEEFLLFATGATALPNIISVVFNASYGTGRHFVGHTCGNVLEIPKTFNSVQEFTLELRSILRSTDAYVFSVL